MKKTTYIIAVLFLLVSVNLFAQSITSISPNSARQKETLTVTISGFNTHFIQATNTYNVWFQQGTSTFIYPASVNATSNVSLTATFTIKNYAPIGKYDVRLYTNTDGNISLSNGFTINAALPSTITISPDSARQKQKLEVTISGINTHFAQATSTYDIWFQQGTGTILWFNQGTSTFFYPDSIKIVNDETLKAAISVSNNTPTGKYDVNIYDDIDGKVSLPGGFTVNLALQAKIIQVTPSQGKQGDKLNISISGENTNFQMSTTTIVWFEQQGYYIYPQSSPNISSNSLINADFNFKSDSPPGYYDVSVYNTIDGLLTKANGFYLEASRPCLTSAPTAIGASRCGDGSVALQASGGKNYLWYNAASGGNVINVGPVFNTSALFDPTTYYVSNVDSCESARVPVIAQINNLNISLSGNHFIGCGDTAQLTTATSYNGSQQLTYSWTPATGLSSSSVASPIASPGQTTKYTVMISDGVCSAYDNVTVYVGQSTFGLEFSTNIQLLYQPPFAIQFNNLTPSLNNYNFTWYFGDGVSLQSNNPVVFHQYSQNGLYDVTLIARNISTGCSDTLFKEGWIYCAGGTTCPQTAAIDQSGAVNGCSGTPVMLTCNTVPVAAYQWNYNGVAIANSNSNIYNATASGNYSVTILLDNCVVTSGLVAVLLSNSPVEPNITETGSLTYCGGGSVMLSTTAAASSYSWSDGGTGQSITVTAPGIYTLKITDNNGCTSQSMPFLVGASPISNPDICIVSVDDATGNNEIVWNKPSTKAIKQFNIYSQGNLANVFTLIGTVPYTSLSVFTDKSSVPAQQSYLYQISAVDTCGAETQLSAVHQTIHLSINQGMGSTWNLMWNYYHGFRFPSYNIYRGTDPSNMTLLTTIASTLNSYTDLNPPAGYVYYQIEVVNPNPCAPSKSDKYGTSKSNIATNNLLIGIDELKIGNGELRIYPNPAHSFFVISCSLLVNSKPAMELYNITGELIKAMPIRSALTQVDISNMPAGIYIVKVSDDNGVAVKRVVKE